MLGNSFRNILQNFIVQMEEMPDTIGSHCQNVLTEPCRFLRIGKITADYYESRLAEEMDTPQRHIMYQCTNAAGDYTHEIRKVTRMGSTVVYRVYPITGEDDWNEEERQRLDMLLKVLFVFNGRTNLMKANYYLTFHDPDMGIYNLKYFFRTINELINTNTIIGYAAIYINLKRFSAVNLQLGREIGTKVMRRFIGSINDILKNKEHIARIGGDNFAILVKQENLEKMVDMLKGSAVVYDDNSGERILIIASAGVYVIDGSIPVTSYTDVMDRISVAVAAAKSSSSDTIAYFDHDMMEKNENALRVISGLAGALKNEEFLIYYQPKVSMCDCRLVGAEALCRWRRNGRLMKPAEFIPILERNMNICKLDFYMLDHTCRDIRRWLDEGKNVVKISVNLSRRHLSDMDLLEHIINIIDRNNVPHQYIELELTETTTDVEFNVLKRLITGLQEAGISTSVDDFGVGYSSLTLIKDIPWNVLKVDKSFLPESGQEYDVKMLIMLKYVVAIAHDLGLECVAEGVETREQIELLRENSCNIIQGFYFDCPLPVTEFETRLDGYRYTMK
ncbi:MAG: bifunctional diguanylate cyclase/phosphodiesterase [Ruminococcus sp.]|nr:bifunctional diguanylate cyclase/phosphodiesterase [Ruminococcus sp.]